MSRVSSAMFELGRENSPQSTFKKMSMRLWRCPQNSNRLFVSTATRRVTLSDFKLAELNQLVTKACFVGLNSSSLFSSKQCGEMLEKEFSMW